MHRARGPLLGCVLALLLNSCAQEINYFQPTATSGNIIDGGRCDVTSRRIEFTAYLPDKRRFLFMSVTALPNLPPTMLVVIDKNYDTRDRAPAKALARDDEEQRIADWALDRARPFVFSSDKIEVNWKDGGNLTRNIRGLVKRGRRYEGAGSSNANIYAFQVQFDLTGFAGDEFDVVLPTVSFDGTTIRPPVVHFSRTNATILAPSKC